MRGAKRSGKRLQIEGGGRIMPDMLDCEREASEAE